jgi:hypothetical protein
MEYDYRLVYICNRINNIYAYSWTHDEFWDCGEYIATAAKLQVGHHPSAYFKWLVPFLPCLLQITNILHWWLTWLLLFRVPLLYYFCFGLRRWFWKINLKNSCTKSKEDKAVELTTSNAIVILGSSFVGSLAFTYSDSFGLMLWKQKFTLWLLHLLAFFG